ALLPGDLGAVEQDGAGLRRHHAHQTFQRRALAGAVAAEQGNDFMALHLQRDIEQDVRVAIIAVEVLDLEQAHGACTPPRYASCTALLLLICSGVPSTRTRPSCSTVTRSTSSNSASMS